MCGGYIEERRCQVCDTVTNIWLNDYSCYWVWQYDDADGYSVSKCSWCNAIKKTKTTTTEKDANCSYQGITEYIYILDGKEVYKGQKTYNHTDHAYNYSYEMLGTTCYDGYKTIQTCKDCGYTYTNSRIDYGHDIDENYVYFSEFGMCDGYIEEWRCKVCNTVTMQMGFSDVKYCNWEWQHDDVDGYSVSKCKDCNAIEKFKADIPTEKDENCFLTETREYFYIVNNKEVYHVNVITDFISHEYEYSYELLGKTCEEGYIRTETCIDCGYTYTSSWTNYEHKTKNEKINLSDLGLCGGYIEENRCQICNIVDIKDFSDTNNWEWQHEDADGYYVYQCSSCNAIAKEKTTESEKDNNCQYTIAWELIYIVNGTEVYRMQTFNTLIEHEYEYSNEPLGTTCEDGYKVTETCKDCEYSNYWTSDHAIEREEYISLSEFGLCGGYIKEGHCQCDTIADIDYDVYCDMELIYDDPSCFSYKCNDCEAVLTYKFDGNECTLSIQKDGKEIYNASYTY